MLKIPSAEKITVVRSAAVKAHPYGPPPEINRGKFLDPKVFVPGRHQALFWMFFCNDLQLKVGENLSFSKIP